MMINLQLLKQIECSDELIKWFKNKFSEEKQISLSELDLLLVRTNHHDLAIELEKRLLFFFFDQADVVHHFTHIARKNVEYGLGYYGSNDVGDDKVYSKSMNAEIISRESNSDILSEGDYANIYSYGYNNGINIKGNYSFVAAHSISTVLNSGKKTKIELRGNNSEVFNSGDEVTVNSSEQNSLIVSYGYHSVIRNSGDLCKVISSGDFSQIFNSGVKSVLAVADCSTIFNSGVNTIIGSSGDGSVVFNSGLNSKISVTGYDSVVIHWNNDDSLIRLGKNCCAVVTWHDGERTRINVVYAGEDGIKPDTWYKTDDSGRFSEATQEEINKLDERLFK